MKLISTKIEKIRYLTVVVFILFIFLPMIGNHTGEGKIVNIELRNPSSFPTISLNWYSMKNMSRNIDNYLMDHFGFRPYLISLHCGIKDRLNMSASPEVLLGKQDWLFLAKNHNVADQYRGLYNFKPHETTNWLKMMNARREWLLEKDIKFIVVIVPNKHTIYSEYLPTYFNKNGSTHREQINAAATNFSDLNIIDLTDVLQKGKNNKRLYHKNDTHWNTFGQFIGYRAIMNKLSKWYPTINSKDISEFEVGQETIDGDLYNLLNKNPRYKSTVPRLKSLYSTNITSNITIGRGNQRVHIVDSRSPSNIEAMIFGDSFLHVSRCNLYFETFSRTVLTHHKGQRFDQKLIEKYKPDVVIYQIAERLLDKFPKIPFDL